MSLAEDENEPYNRWQGFRITQLSICISLFLTFSVATLGFSISLLVQKFEITNCLAKASFLFSVILGLLSVSCGSVACLTRLWDFRKTAAVVSTVQMRLRKRMSNAGEKNTDGSAG